MLCHQGQVSEADQTRVLKMVRDLEKSTGGRGGGGAGSINFWRMISPTPFVKMQLRSCRPVDIWQSGPQTSIRCLRPSLAGIICRAQVKSSVPAVQDLLAAIQSTERGLSTTPAQRSAILSATEALTELGRGTTTTSDALSATWKLLWTTEKVPVVQ